MLRSLLCTLALVAALSAQQSQSISAVSYKAGTVEIQNVTYHIASANNPARAADVLLLRKTVRSKQVLMDEGIDSTVTLEAWPLGSDTKQKPLYTVKATGTDGNVVDDSIFVVSRGLEEVEWWSAYKLSSGGHLFDTYLPLVSFSIARDTVKTRYLGLVVATDDTTDARLKQPNVIGILVYASAEKVLREVLLTCDDLKRAPILRSLADTTRRLTVNDALALTLSFRQDFPSPPNPVELTIPISGDDLDLKTARLPPSLHAAALKK